MEQGCHCLEIVREVLWVGAPVVVIVNETYWEKGLRLHHVVSFR